MSTQIHSPIGPVAKFQQCHGCRKVGLRIIKEKKSKLVYTKHVSLLAFFAWLL